MRATVAIERSTAFTSRLALAFVELTLTTTVIVGAIVAGHNLREWRDWYASTYHPWLESQRSAPEVTEP